MATADASSDVRVVIATWNCACAAPAKPKNPGDRRKLSKTLTRLRSEGCVPDALALQETKFSSNKQTGEMEHLHFAMSDTEHKYTWLHPIGKRLPVQENMAQQHTGRKTDLGSWLLIRKGGPLDGGNVLHLPWDDQHRVVAVRTRHGLLVAAYLSGEDFQRYLDDFIAFLERHKHELLAVVGDLNIGFEPCDCTDEDGIPLTADQVRPGYLSKPNSLLSKGGLKDAWACHHSGPRERPRDYTRATELIGEAREGKHGKDIQSGSWMRCDHVLVPEALIFHSEATIYSALEPHEEGRRSDHVPVAVRITLPPTWSPKPTRELGVIT